MSTPGRWTSALFLSLLPLAATATDNCNPHGTWLVNISPPPETFIPPISELISFQPGGVAHETSSDLPNVVAHGAWKRRPNCRIEFRVLKQIFDATELEFLGYVRITGRAKIDGTTYSTEPGDVKSELVFGPDPDAPPAVSVELSSSLGKRLRSN